MDANVIIRICISVLQKLAIGKPKQNQRLKSCPASRSTAKMLWETLLKQATRLIIHTATHHAAKEANKPQGRSKHKNREPTREETMFEYLLHMKNVKLSNIPKPCHSDLIVAM